MAMLSEDQNAGRAEAQQLDHLCHRNLAIRVTGLGKGVPALSDSRSISSERNCHRHATPRRALGSWRMFPSKCCAGAWSGIIGPNGVWKEHTSQRSSRACSMPPPGMSEIFGRLSAILELRNRVPSGCIRPRQHCLWAECVLECQEPRLRRKFRGSSISVSSRTVIDEPFRTYSSGMQAQAHIRNGDQRRSRGLYRR